MKAKKILFATDFSPASETALELASSLAADTGATLLIAYTHEPAPYPISATEFGMLVDNPTYEAEFRESEKKLAAIHPTAEGVACVHHCLEGTPADAIVELAADEQVDFVVVGSHGRTGLSRMLMGSVAEAIVRHAKCPVVVVKHAAKLDQELASNS